MSEQRSEKKKNRLGLPTYSICNTSNTNSCLVNNSLLPDATQYAAVTKPHSVIILPGNSTFLLPVEPVLVLREIL